MTFGNGDFDRFAIGGTCGRENEIDMVVAAEFVTPEHVARMRQNAGGLLCIAIENNFATSLGLQYMHEILAESSISNKEMIMGLAPYGDHPTFSLSVNHYQTYTGITDKDRALTINEMAKIYNVECPLVAPSYLWSPHHRHNFFRLFTLPGPVNDH